MIEAVDHILKDKTIKAKKRVSSISHLLMDGQVAIHQLVDAAKSTNDIDKATIIEAIEFTSKTNAEILDKQGFEFITASLRSAASRVKWESAKVIANTAHLFPEMLGNAVGPLLDNAEHPGNVVRWSAAGALCKIILCNTDLNSELIPTVEAIEKRETDNAIKKIYQRASKSNQNTAVDNQ